LTSIDKTSEAGQPPEFPASAKGSTESAGFANMTEMYDEVVPVIENRPLTGGHFLLSLHSSRQASATRPGQFAMVRLLGHSDVILRRPMSIYDVQPQSFSGPRHGSAGDDKPNGPELIRLLYKIVGRGTRMMGELKPGSSVGLLGPLGHGFLAEDYLASAKQANEVLHVAGGVGIAALLMPARELAGHGVRQRLFFGGRTGADLVGVSDFAGAVQEIGLATEDGSKGYRGYVTKPLEDYLAHSSGQRFLILVCGPWAMLRASVALANRYGHPCLVSMENRMGCGLGVCLGCSIRVDGTGHGAYQRVCTEGPVFWSQKVIWEREEIPKI
jgi:dihydroorotate dehydrogenase electron transfer subunit